MHYQVFLGGILARAANTDRSDYMNWTVIGPMLNMRVIYPKNTEIQTQVITQKYQM